MLVRPDLWSVLSARSVVKKSLASKVPIDTRNLVLVQFESSGFFSSLFRVFRVLCGSWFKTIITEYTECTEKELNCLQPATFKFILNQYQKLRLLDMLSSVSQHCNSLFIQGRSGIYLKISVGAACRCGRIKKVQGTYVNWQTASLTRRKLGVRVPSCPPFDN